MTINYMPIYTKLRDILDVVLLQEAVAAGFVRVHTHPAYPELNIYNYTEKCAWDKAWTRETLESRGLIVVDGADPIVLARPFPKFFNHDELLELPPIGAPAEVTDKMDGSLGIGYQYAGKWGIATRGSFASDQAQWATRWLYGAYLDKHSMFGSPEGWTPLFEIVYPENRIVVNYESYQGLVLLGWRNIASGEIRGPLAFPDNWRGDRTEIMPANSLLEALRLPSRHNAEGVVVRWLDNGHQVKIKQDDYKRMHAVVTNTTSRTVWEMLCNGEDPLTLEGLPDEFTLWVSEVKAALELQARNKEFIARSTFNLILKRLEGNHTRGDFASLAKRYDYATALFQLYDGKDINAWCWKQIKPETIERPFQENQ